MNNDIEPDPKVYDLSEGMETTETSPGSRSALIVEDDETLALILKGVLEINGYYVEQHLNGADALKSVLAREFDVIICDMVMPTFPGDMFFRAVERIKPHLCQRFLFITGHKEDLKINTFIKSVRGSVLYKPFQFDEMLRMLETIRKRSTPSK